MKKNIYYVGAGIFLALVLLTGQAFAQGTHSFAYNIPFAFHAGAAKMPAGQYIVRIPSAVKGLVYIDSQNRNEHAILMTMPFLQKQNQSQRESKLVFHQYGQTCFLAAVWDGLGIKGQELIRSEAEKEFTKRAGIPKTIIVAESK